MSEGRGGTHAFDYGDYRQVETSDGPTPSQTVGPFFAYGLTPGAYGYALPEIHGGDLALGPVEGERIVIQGQVLDGDGVPVHDAMVELVQADAAGVFVNAPRNDGFTGFGRCGTGAGGPSGDTRFRFATVKPGAVGPGYAPCVTLIVMARGMLNHVITRMYFPGDLAGDPVLEQVPEARRHTLIATKLAPGRYGFDIRLQGADETVFFDL